MGEPTLAELYALEQQQRANAMGQAMGLPVPQRSAPIDTGPLYDYIGGPAAPPPPPVPPPRQLTVAEQFRMDPNARTVPTQARRSVLGNDATTEDDKERFAATEAKRAADPNPLFQVPSVTHKPPGSAQAEMRALLKPPPEMAAAPAGLGNKYGGGAAGSSAEAPSAPGINWGGAGGTATVAAHEVPMALPGRQKAVTDAIDKEADAVAKQGDAARAEGDANAEVERQRGIGMQHVAKANEDAGVDMKLRAQAAADESRAYQKHIDAFAEKLTHEKFDANRFYNDESVPQTFARAIAVGMGAIGQAFLHTSTNVVADHIESLARNDVANQRAAHDAGREHLADMKTAYAQALQVTHDKDEAERVATGYALKAAEHDANAMTANATSGAAKAKGEQIAAAISERAAMVGEKKAKVEMDLNPLAQARTVNTGPDMTKVYATARSYTEEQAKLGTVVPPDAAIRWAYKMHTGRDPLPGAGGFVGGSKSDPANKDLKETQTGADAFNKQIDDLTAHPVTVDSGLGTAALSHLPQRIAPKSNDAKQQLNEINTRNLQAIGKVAKDADGKPNKEMIKKIEERFEIHLSDTPEMKQEKLNGIRHVYNALAQQQGAKVPDLGTAGPPTFKP